MANNADAMGLAAGHFRTAASSAPAYWQNPKKPMTPQQIDFLARQGRKIARLGMRGGQYRPLATPRLVCQT
jgi:hypothetical protein